MEVARRVIRNPPADFSDPDEFDDDLEGAEKALRFAAHFGVVLGLGGPSSPSRQDIDRKINPAQYIKQNADHGRDRPGFARAQGQTSEQQSHSAGCDREQEDAQGCQPEIGMRQIDVEEENPKDKRRNRGQQSVKNMNQ